MRSSRRRKTNAFRDSLVFWSLVLFLGAGIACAGFVLGRDWLGRRMAGVDMTPGAPRMVPTDEDPAIDEPKSKTPPAKVEVKMEEREPDDFELRRIEDKEASGPQDGAQLHEEEGDGTGEDTDDAPSLADEGDDGEEPVERESTRARSEKAKAKRTRGRFVVTAGAFDDASNAQKVVADLKDKGYSPVVELTRRGGRELRRVVVSTTSSRAEAVELRDELEREGIRAGIIAND